MSRSRRQRTGLWIATLSNSKSTRIVAKSDTQAARRANQWCLKQGDEVYVVGIHEVI